MFLDRVLGAVASVGRSLPGARSDASLSRVGRNRGRGAKLAVWTIVLGVPFVFGVPSALAAAEESVVRPNIVLIAADDHGYRYASFMGHSMVKTPNLDRLAEGGTLFRTAYNSASVCEPALRTLLDGSEPYPRREGRGETGRSKRAPLRASIGTSGLVALRNGQPSGPSGVPARRWDSSGPRAT